MASDVLITVTFTKFTIQFKHFIVTNYSTLLFGSQVSQIKWIIHYVYCFIIFLILIISTYSQTSKMNSIYLMYFINSIYTTWFYITLFYFGYSLFSSEDFWNNQVHSLLLSSQQRKSSHRPLFASPLLRFITLKAINYINKEKYFPLPKKFIQL